jgi:glycosyltransferase involved in cell wall biosynthesis
MKKISVLVPCFNEEKTIGDVIGEFRTQLCDAEIFVYDNNSTDDTRKVAEAAGAIVRSETRQGKGNVVRSMFGDVDADVYVMVDGDGTYPSDKVHDLIAPILADEADMVCGTRLHQESESTFNRLNFLGNKAFLFILNTLFRVQMSDILSGYRAFNRRVVKNTPILSRGFDIETELTLKVIERNYRVVEIPVSLTPRPEGSTSKIKIVRDGFLIINTILALLRDYRPLTAFGAVGLFLMLMGLIPGGIVIHEFLTTGLVLHIPSAILSVGLELSGTLLILVGLMLHAVARRFQEMDRFLQNMNEAQMKAASDDE